MRESANDQASILRGIQSLESELAKHIESTLKQREEAKQEPEVGSSQNTDGTQAPINQAGVESRFELLNGAAVSLGVVAKQLERERSQLTIGKVTGDDEAITFVGIPEDVAKATDARIGDVNAGKRATAVVGVFPRNLNMDGIFKRN